MESPNIGFFFSGVLFVVWFSWGNEKTRRNREFQDQQKVNKNRILLSRPAGRGYVNFVCLGFEGPLLFVWLLQQQHTRGGTGTGRNIATPVSGNKYLGHDEYRIRMNAREGSGNLKWIVLRKKTGRVNWFSHFPAAAAECRERRDLCCSFEWQDNKSEQKSNPQV